MKIEYFAGKWKPINGCGDDLIDEVISEIYCSERPFRFTQLGNTSETDWLLDSLLDFNMEIGVTPKVFEVNEVYIFHGNDIYTLEQVIKILENELTLLKIYRNAIRLGS
jgi:hypothetical protein